MHRGSHIPAQQSNCRLHAPAKENGGGAGIVVLLIDLCNVIQENLAEVKMIIQELQTCLEGGHDVSIQLKIVCFVHMVKKATSEGCRLTRLLSEARDGYLST
ncbi:hypothetical protein SEVIR_8G040401v4 [Setaria viridis]